MKGGDVSTTFSSLPSSCPFSNSILAIFFFGAWIRGRSPLMKWLGFEAVLGVIAPGLLYSSFFLFFSLPVAPKPVSIKHAVWRNFFSPRRIATLRRLPWRGGHQTHNEDSGWQSLRLPPPSFADAHASGPRSAPVIAIKHQRNSSRCGCDFVLCVLMVSVVVITRQKTLSPFPPHRTGRLLSVTCVQVDPRSGVDPGARHIR